ncbi:hypothetical protein P43SY_004484 [Pythium insidiosum]|uniref:PDZ domain-containing protein n=1 Tax=Pythium insidiosum TaxID=114742 RepID=A0AAD5Q2D2_PYTIN|nr:hypothetical protein P43SY_004484 [Pythium insidiosum]
MPRERFGLPRTSEVLWNGSTALPFTLKRRRTGAILVSKIRDSSAALELRVGSELKLVGGFPVTQLTLSEVKKVMLRAPKPVSLVFVNHDDAVLDNMSFLSDDRGSFENEFAGVDDDALQPVPRESGEWKDTASSSSGADDVASAEWSSSSCSPAASCSPTPRKASKLKIALDRMNELLNKPVRRSALNITTGKSIVV